MAFLKQQHRLNYAAAMALIEELRKTGEPFSVYNKSLPRLPSPGSPPWDFNAAKWQGVEWAPTFADDQDPELRGFK